MPLFSGEDRGVELKAGGGWKKAARWRDKHEEVPEVPRLVHNTKNVTVRPFIFYFCRAEGYCIPAWFLALGCVKYAIGK